MLWNVLCETKICGADIVRAVVCFVVLITCTFGGQQKRDSLLEAIVLPDKQIAKGFDPVVIVTESGKVHAGIIKDDGGRQVRLMTAEGNLVVIPKVEMEEQARGRSAMPEDLIKKLPYSELRDLVEFLAQLK